MKLFSSKSIFIISLIFVLIFANSLPAQVNEKKIKELISKMTLEEKAGQLYQTYGQYNDSIKDVIREDGIGSFLSFDAGKINEFQRIAVEESRLKIPIIFARDVIHGYKTIAPIPLGQAASFNEALVEQAARIAAEEATSDGIRWTFAPMIDISRDARWGRIAESFGEDPVLTARLGMAMVKGFQTNDMSQPNALAACAKHFVGYGAAEGGRDYNSTQISERLMRNIYLYPFQQLAKGGVATMMTAFNDNDGIPMSGNKHYLKNVLRKEWNFNGAVVSDWEAVHQMTDHGYCANGKEAAQKALLAGVDMEMTSDHYKEYLPELVKQGKIKMADIDRAVANILRLKMRLGLFSNPYFDDKKERNFYSEQNLASAKELAVQSMVLLKNENKTLPLGSSIKKIAVIGPLADDGLNQMGTWVMDGEKEHSVTFIRTLQNEFANKVSFEYVPALKYPRDSNTGNFEKALSAARNADIIVYFMGEESFMTGEAHSLADIELPATQKELLKQLKSTGKPVVLVVMAGRPIPLNTELPNCDALLFAWHPGTMGGPAIADLLFGKAVPSAKLPVTFPAHGGQIPIYYNHHNTGRPAPDSVLLLKNIEVAPLQFTQGSYSAYLDYGRDPLFPFGYGLSYTTFKYDNLRLSKSVITKSEKLRISFSLTNTGDYDAEEVAQLYVRDIAASLARPVKELKDFRRVFLKKGETKEVLFEISADRLAFWNDELKYGSEAGEFDILVGGNSIEGLKNKFWLKD